MTNDELNAKAAEIMGWRKSENGFYLNPKGSNPIHTGYADTERCGKLWNPCENTSQAFELANEMCEDYQLKYDGDIYDFTIAGVLMRGDSLPDTITRACVAAAGAKK